MEREGSEVIATEERTEQLHRDVFPCDVTIGARVIAKGARVFVTNRRVIVYTANSQVAYEAELTRAAPERNRGSLVGPLDIETADGLVWLNRGSGCGCHAPVRALARPVAW